MSRKIAASSFFFFCDKLTGNFIYKKGQAFGYIMFKTFFSKVNTEQVINFSSQPPFYYKMYVFSENKRPNETFAHFPYPTNMNM